jgi:hypothetical protein
MRHNCYRFNQLLHRAALLLQNKRFTTEAVLWLLRKEEAAAVLFWSLRRIGADAVLLARRLSGGAAALASWCGKDATAQKRRVAELEKEIEKRDQVIATIANRFLKNSRKGRTEQRLACSFVG